MREGQRVMNVTDGRKGTIVKEWSTVYLYLVRWDGERKGVMCRECDIVPMGAPYLWWLFIVWVIVAVGTFVTLVG